MRDVMLFEKFLRKFKALNEKTNAIKAPRYVKGVEEFLNESNDSGKYLYIRYNKQDHYVIVGDEKKLGGRESAYHSKGTRLDNDEWELYRTLFIGNLRDHDIHKRMRNEKELVKIFEWDGEANQGIRKTREGFIIRQDSGISDRQALYKLEQYIIKMINGDSTRIEYTERAGQGECISKIREFMSNESKNKLLINAVPRFGKTATVLAGLIGDKNPENRANRILVLTSKPTDTHDSWMSEIRKFKFGEEYSAFDVSELNANENIENPKYMIFMSLQSLGRKMTDKEDTKEEAKEINDEIKAFKKNQQKIANIEFDVLVIDECHFGVDTNRSNDILKHINFKKKIEISGTPFRKILNGQYSKDEIFSYTIVDDYNDNHNNKDYIHLNILSYDVDMMKSEEDNVERTELDNYRKMVKMFEDYGNQFSWDALFNEKRKGEIKAFVDNVLNLQLSNFAEEHDIYSSLICVSKIAHAKKILDYLESTNGMQVINLCGENRTSSTLSEVNEILRRNRLAKKKTVLITCGRWCTGVTLNFLDAFFWCQNCNSPETFMQYCMRTCSKYDDPKLTKSQAWVFCIGNGQAIEMRNKAMSYMDSISNKTSGSKNEIKAYSHIMPLWKIYKDHKGDLALKQIDEDETVHLYDDFLVSKPDSISYEEFFNAKEFDWSEFDIKFSGEENWNIKKSIVNANDDIDKATIYRDKEEKDDRKPIDKEEKEKEKKNFNAFEKFIIAIKKVPYIMFDRDVEVKNDDNFISLFNNNEAEDLVGITKEIAKVVIKKNLIKDKARFYQKLNLIKRALDDKSKTDDVWGEFAEKYMKKGIDHRSRKEEKYTYSDIVPMMYENEDLSGKRILLLSNGKISKCHKEIEDRAKEVVHLVIIDRDNPLNKTICEKQYKNLGLKGMLKFIDGEEDCEKRVEEFLKNY